MLPSKPDPGLAPALPLPSAGTIVVDAQMMSNFAIRTLPVPETALGRHGASGQNARSLAEKDQENEFGSKHNKKLELEFVLVIQTKWNPATLHIVIASITKQFQRAGENLALAVADILTINDLTSTASTGSDL